MDRRAYGKYGHVWSQIQRAATWMYCRETVDVVCAVIYDGRAWMTGDPEPMVSGHFAASLTSSRLVLTLRELLPSWPGKAPLG